MNIAIFTNNYLPNPYGVSMSIESFRKEFEKRGHTVYVLAPEFEGFVDENKNVYRFPSINFTFKKINFPLAIPYSYRMSGILKNLEIDVVHCQHPNLLGWAGKRWAKKKNVPMIFTWHTLYDQYAHFAPFFVPNKLASWWSISNAVRFANKSDQVITPTLSVEKIIKKWGVTNENVSSIASGVDEKEFENADGAEIRKKFGIADDETVLFFIGRITAEKNVEFLMKAVVKFLVGNNKVHPVKSADGGAEQFNRVKFLVCGEGDMIESMQEIAREAGVLDHVIFAGVVSASERKNYFAASDILVYSSKSETQGMIISEALYMGLPVVAVNATGVKDLVTNQVDGLLVKENEEEFASAIERLANDGELRKKFSQNAKRIAKENYTSEICAKKLLNIYEQTIKRKKDFNA